MKAAKRRSISAKKIMELLGDSNPRAVGNGPDTFPWANREAAARYDDRFCREIAGTGVSLPTLLVIFLSAT